MEIHKRSSWLLLLLGISLLATTLQGVQGEAEQEGPSESECRPYIEKALKELEAGEDSGTQDKGSGEQYPDDSKEDAPTVEITTDDSDHQDSDGEDDTHEVEGGDEAEADEKAAESEDKDDTAEDTDDSKEATNSPTSDEDKDGDGKPDDDNDDTKSDEGGDTDDKESAENQEAVAGEDDNDSKEDAGKSVEGDQESAEDKKDSAEDDQKDDGEDSKQQSAEDDQKTSGEDDKQDSKEDSKEDEQDGDGQDSKEDKKDSGEDEQSKEVDAADSKQDDEDSKEGEKSAEAADKDDDTKEDSDDSKQDTKSGEDDDKSKEADDDKDSKEINVNIQGDEADSKEDDKDDGTNEESSKEGAKQDDDDSKEDAKKDDDDSKEDAKKDDDDSKEETKKDDDDSKEDAKKDDDSKEDTKKDDGDSKEDKDDKDDDDDDDDESGEAPEEELTLEIDIPEELRPREHVEQLLKLDEESEDTEKIINRISEITLRELKKLYENAIKPLEVLYKYRDLSNRHFGDPEIFSKPLILFMGPWSGGKSSIINYLVDNEYNETSLRTGAEPSPAYFNIMTYGEEYEIIDGTQLAADFTFSGLQKFGQGLEERLRGHKLPRTLLEKVNIVEIPGILEVRKQVSRVFPFNDACQWFIDRADIIFLVYDPSKLDVGPETEAILDQLKGREHQTRIILNKADQVKPEELMRVQGALIWNISPLMSSAQPPVMYTTSLWSRPYEPWAPVRLLQAQERAFLRDLRSAIDKRIENKIASARRFAVRVRNHAKMVDCYLTTYYNHKSVFGNKKQVADEIIDHPQDYHIYEGLSTLTNISRYDLPDPEVYRDFFKLNPLYEFQQLSATCTYFRGCPINRLDVAIAYDLPELVGKHRRLVDSALAEASGQTVPGS